MAWHRPTHSESSFARSAYSFEMLEYFEICALAATMLQSEHALLSSGFAESTPPQREKLLLPRCARSRECGKVPLACRGRVRRHAQSEAITRGLAFSGCASRGVLMTNRRMQVTGDWKVKTGHKERAVVGRSVAYWSRTYSSEARQRMEFAKEKQRYNSLRCEAARRGLECGVGGRTRRSLIRKTVLEDGVK